MDNINAFVYLYCDIFSFFRPGHIEEVLAGFMGPVAINQMSLVSASLVLAILALMIMPVYL
ncbi:MAG: DUF6326 family protein [Clostridiales bacterium]|jgi:hypothetical protein|nr:DUF6326 family protein [Clostridiales bacterium]